MTVRFGNRRVCAYIVVFVLSGVVLGLSAHFANLFLPRLHRDFSIFSIIIPSLTIFALLLTLQWSQPRTEAVLLLTLGVLWLAMGAWSTDVIGNVQCDALGDLRIATMKGSIRANEYCYEMKVIQAFSWSLFVLFALFLYTLCSLATQAERMGRPGIWQEPIQELGWWGETPGFYNTGGRPSLHHTYPPSPMPYPPTPMQGGQMTVNGVQYVQQPGHNLVIHPGVNGQPTTVSNVPI